MDVEQQLHLAAAALKKELADFDRDAFSARLYESLGISRSEEGRRAAGVDHQGVVDPRVDSQYRSGPK